MEELIGKIRLDYTYYPGEDFYCDGVIEDEMLEIVKNYSSVEFPRIIEERKSWPILYHLSPLRENIVSWLPIDKSMKVLEVGSGCGAITGSLSEKAGTVTCVDLSKKRSLINAHRHSDCENVTIHLGNFQDIEPDLATDYDYICLIGVFEYGHSYINSETPYEDFVRIMRKHLKPNGRIIIAIENKFGLKYWAGCKEDHNGEYFSGLEGYPKEDDGARTFTKKGLEKLLLSVEETQYSFFYPYPDYKFLTRIYSDQYLPKIGELSDNHRNFDRERLFLFDEKHVFDSIIRDDMFPEFSNSFLVVIGDDLPIIFEKYSNDRALEYAIRTEILNDDGEKKVKKHPLYNGAVPHIQKIVLSGEKLQQRYIGGRLQICKSKLSEKENVSAEFEYVEGVTLTELLDKCLEQNDFDGFHSLFFEYVERINYRSEVPVSDYDLVFSNILVKDDTWTVIDYEWTFDKQMDTKEIAFRALYCYILENDKRNKLNTDLIFEKLEISEEIAEDFRKQEREFQRMVTGKRLSMAEIRNLLDKKIIEPLPLIAANEKARQKEAVQIYIDKGKGYSEEESYFVPDPYEEVGHAKFELLVDGNTHAVRIDPSHDSCVIKIIELTLNGISIPLSKPKVFLTNGKIAERIPDKKMQTSIGPSIVFGTTDPWIHINLMECERKAQNVIGVEFELVKMPSKMALDIEGAVKKKHLF